VEAGTHRNRGWIASVGLSAILFVIVSLLSSIPIVREWQLRLADSFFRIAPQPGQRSRVVVVSIDDQSLQQYGRWPWSRELLVEITNKLAQAGAGPIGLDILLSEPQTSEADRDLARAFRAAGRVVVVDKIAGFSGTPRWIEPLPEFAGAATVGHAQAILDMDSVCRRFPPRELTLNGSRWAFAIEVARKADPQRAQKFLQAYGVPASDEAAGANVAKPLLIRIPFRRDGFDTIPASRILSGFDPALVRGRPVLVGFGPTEIGDRLSTPLSAELPTPGIEVHAQILDSILTGTKLFETPLWMSGVALLVTCGAVVMFFRKPRGPALIAVMVVGLCAVVYGLCVAVFVVSSRFAPVGAMMLATVLAPSLVYTAEFVVVERSLNRQLRSLRAWLANRREIPARRDPDLSWRLELLQGLQSELGSLYELHKALLESTQDLVAIFDTSGKLLLKNELFSTAFELGMGKHLSLAQVRERLVPSEDAPPVVTGDLEEGEVHLDGQLYSLRVAPLPSTTVSPTGGTILTLTNLRTRVERDRARAEALGFITHELRTPLASIHGYSEMMMRDPAGAADEGAAETIFRETKRLLALISSYLDVLRLDAGAKPLTTHVIDLESLVSQVFDILQPLASQAGMKLVLESPEPITLEADAPLITGAVLNLVSNAIKYGQPGTEIRVTCSQQGREVVASVYNIGQPIREAEISRLFDPYYRTTKAETSKPGWGLGLAFVKRIVEKHGGSVKVSRGENGTVFEMHLPAESSVEAIAARSTS
jgi:signal transduction histidine kinase/CHASE2 domain-containing sensor protein